MKHKIQYRKVKELLAYDHNPRINDHAIEKTAAAIEEFGFRVPILLQADNTIIDGHLRLKAAKSLFMEEVPTIVVADLTEAQIKAFRLSINKIADLAHWDIDMLEQEIEDLKQMDFDISKIGFTESDLNFDWNSDLSLVEKTQSNLDGITQIFKIEADKAVAEEFGEKLKALIGEFEIGVRLT